MMSKNTVLFAFVLIIALSVTVDNAHAERWEHFGDIRKNGLTDDDIINMLILVIFGVIANVLLFRKSILKKLRSSR